MFCLHLYPAVLDFFPSVPCLFLLWDTYTFCSLNLKFSLLSYISNSFDLSLLFRYHLKCPSSEMPSPVMNGSLCGSSHPGASRVNAFTIYFYYWFHACLLCELLTILSVFIPNFQQCPDIVGDNQWIVVH